MTGRQRLAATLAHQSPDRVAVDFGATAVTGIHVSAVTRLRRQVLGDASYRVKVNEPYQMLGEIDDELREALPIDVVGVLGRKSIFGTESRDWKPFTLFDGTECLVPGQFNVTTAPDGGWHIYPEGDTAAMPSGHMPRGGYFFDSIVRQHPVDDERLDPADNLEEFALLGPADLAVLPRAEGLARGARRLRRASGGAGRRLRRHRARARAVPEGPRGGYATSRSGTFRRSRARTTSWRSSIDSALWRRRTSAP